MMSVWIQLGIILGFLNRLLYKLCVFHSGLIPDWISLRTTPAQILRCAAQFRTK